MNKFLFSNITVSRETVLENSENFRVGKKTKFCDFKIKTGKGQFATEIYNIHAGQIMFDANVSRKEYSILKAEVNNLIRANIIMYGDKFVKNIHFAEKQLQKGLKEKFECKSCSFISLEGSKTIEGDFLVSSIGKEKEREMVHLISAEDEVIHYDAQEVNKNI